LKTMAISKMAAKFDVVKKLAKTSLNLKVSLNPELWA
jgi:hypothetical protein